MSEPMDRKPQGDADSANDAQSDVVAEAAKASGEANEGVVAAKSADAKPKKGSEDQFNRLGTGSIGKILREFSIPAIVSMIIGGAYNFMAAIFMGQGIGDIGLAVSTVANPMMILIMSVAMLVGAGGNALCAIKLGEKKKDEAEHVLGNTVTISIIGSVLIALACWFAIDPILSLSGATSETWEPAKLYLRIIGTGCVIQVVGMGLNNFIRTAGDPIRALWTMAIGQVVCVICSFLFVMMFRWGFVGQGAAVLVGQAVSTATILYYFMFSKKCPLKLYLRNIPFKRSIPLQILTMGSAPFIINIAGAVVNVIINNQIATYGAMSPLGETGAFAMFAVIQQVAMIVMFPVTGISVGAQPLLGYNYGARLPRRVKQTLSIEFKFAVTCCIIMWIFIQVFASSIVTLFGIQGDLLSFTQYALRIQTAVMPLMVFQIIISSYYQATGRPGRSAFLSLTRQILYLIPLYYGLPILIGNFFPGVDQLMGIILGPPIGDILSFITAIIFVIIEYRVLRRAIKQADSGEPINFGPKPTPYELAMKGEQA